MVDAVDPRRAGAVAPRKASAFELCSSPALADQAVVRSAREKEVVGVGWATVRPLPGMVHLAVIAGLRAVRVRATTIAGVADQPLISGCDAPGAAEIQRALSVIVENGQVGDRVGGHPDQVAHRK